VKINSLSTPISVIAHTAYKMHLLPDNRYNIFPLEIEHNLLNWAPSKDTIRYEAIVESEPTNK